jgi:hypothetical protein
MNADAKLDPLRFRNTGIAAGHRLLRFGHTAERIDDAGELGEKPVAGGLNHPAAMRSDRRVDHLSPDGPQPVEGSFFVHPDQARITSDVGCQDCGEPTLRAVSSLEVHYPTA